VTTLPSSIPSPNGPPRCGQTLSTQWNLAVHIEQRQLALTGGDGFALTGLQIGSLGYLDQLAPLLIFVA